MEAVTDDDSAVCRFETTVEAAIHGDVASVQSLLGKHPELAHARSTRVTPFNPPVHRATLLHYVAANGVEGYRQLTPPNAVAIADTLLDAGADVDALADMYGGQCTTMSMLVSSTPPARAGVQVALAETLIDHGASVEALGSGHWASPLMTALAFGFTDAADALVRRGARVETLAAAAGLGRVLDVRRLLDRADSPECHRALALSAQHGHVEIVRLLLDAGEDPNRYNPEGNHAHSTPLHQAVLAGRVEVVQLLVEHGARLDIKDAIYESTPLGWAVYAGQPGIAEYPSRPRRGVAHFCWVRFRVPGSGFQVGFLVPRSFQVPRRFDRPVSLVPIFQVRRRLDWSVGDIRNLALGTRNP